MSSWAVKFVTSYLYHLTGYDTRVWGVAIATILITAGLGTGIPSWHVSRANPVEALRVE